MADRGAAPTPATPGLLRSINDRVVLDLLLEHHALTRGDVVRLTGVSKPTASQLLTRLENSGHVLQNGYAENTRGGRNSLVYELNPRAGFAAAIDVTIGGIQAKVADLRGTVIGTHHTDSGNSNGNNPDAAVATLKAAVAEAGLELDQLSSIVVAAPGSYDRDTDSLNYAGHLSNWQEHGLVARLSALTGVPVRIENDVNLVAVAEYRAGAVRGVNSFFLFWVDERIGGALMIDGRLFRGSSGGAGEVAFLQLPGVPVVRNPVRENRGGFEDLVGERQIVERGQHHGIAGDDAPGMVAAAAAAPEGASAAFLDDIASRYAIGLASLIAVLDPAVIVLSGSIAHAGGDELLKRLSEQIQEVAIANPRLALGEVAADPVITGALLASLNHTRNKVFTT